MRLIDADELIERTRAHGQRIAYVESFIQDIKEAPTVATDINVPGKWISVNDRLPEERINPLTQDFAEVICFCDFGGEPRRTDVRTYKFGKPTWDKDGHFLHGGQIMDGVITHWQYLPVPPKEDDA